MHRVYWRRNFIFFGMRKNSVWSTMYESFFCYSAFGKSKIIETEVIIWSYEWELAWKIQKCETKKKKCIFFNFSFCFTFLSTCFRVGDFKLRLFPIAMFVIAIYRFCLVHKVQLPKRHELWTKCTTNSLFYFKFNFLLFSFLIVLLLTIYCEKWFLIFAF